MGENEKIGLGTNRLTRRDLLLRIAGVSMWGLCDMSKLFSPLAVAEKQRNRPQPAPAPSSLAQGDDQFLEELEKANFQYFWEQASPQTGLIKDRCNVRANDTTAVASIAATGFGLTALCIGEKRGFVSFAD
ncbi:MAG TPA: hypothetical protein VK302_12840, partial [Terriglobales bacterium]|nr:hypothetical protein [Terriglobales bacterium]